MLQNLNRRNLLALGASATALGSFPLARAAGPARVLKINTLASAAAVNVPMQYALRAELAKMPGFAAPEIQPTAKIPQIVQQVLSGASDLGDADVASTLAAAEAGADLRIIGLSYNNTSQVVVVNADRHASLEALAKAGGTIAVNSIGDFMYVMLQGVFKKRGIAADKVAFVEMGSSGDRARALIAGRVDAVPMHIEQALQLKGRGNFQILVRPWKEYDNWFSAVLMAPAAWLQKEENKTAAVAVLKSTLIAFRKTNEDYGWYKARVAEFASSKDTQAAGDDLLKPVWETLTKEIKAFPRNMEQLTVDEFAKVATVYKQTGALKGTLNLSKIIDRSYLERAIKELG